MLLKYVPAYKCCIYFQENMVFPLRIKKKYFQSGLINGALLIHFDYLQLLPKYTRVLKFFFSQTIKNQLHLNSIIFNLILLENKDHYPETLKKIFPIKSGFIIIDIPGKFVTP